MQLIAWLVPFIFWSIASFLPHYGLGIAIILFYFLDSTHQVATLPLISREKFYWLSALVITSLALVFSSIPESLPSKVWLSLYLYWGAFHIMRQHYGFLRIEQIRTPPPTQNIALAEIIALYSGVSFPYLLNLSKGWVFETYPGTESWRLPLPEVIPWITFVIFLSSFGYVIIHSRQWNGRLKLISLAVSNFMIALLISGKHNIFLAMIFITSFHDVQYLHITNQLIKKRYHLLSLFLIAIALESLRNRIGFLRWMNFNDSIQRAISWVFLSYTYMHYIFDTKIWKLKSNPDLIKRLGLSPPSTKTS